MLEEYPRAALRDHQREPQVLLHHRADNQCQDQRCHLQMEFPAYVSQYPESDHQTDFNEAEIQAVHTHDTEDKN